MAPRRTTVQEDAFVLHHYDWSESSLILDVYTRYRGRVVLVAKGAKKPTSNFRPVLLPLQPLRVTYGRAKANPRCTTCVEPNGWVGMSCRAEMRCFRVITSTNC